jgi:uncharacterized ion transporter superfamily protein YfcC
MSIGSFLGRVNDLILNPLILLAFALSFVYFIYGIVKFLYLQPGDKERDIARNAILWGFVGMTIMFSVFGIIKFILTTFGINQVSPDAKQFLKL